MADPFTIIGTTSAVISFVLTAGKIIVTAHSLYDSTADSTAENNELEDVTSKLNQLLDTFKDANTTRPDSSPDKSITDLSLVCHGLGQKILTLLKKTKVKKAHSMRESIRAAMATVWTKRVVIELRNELGLCTTQLCLHLQVVMRSESGEKLQRIVDANVLNARELSSLKKLLDTIKNGQELEIEALRELRDILCVSKSNLETMNRERILRALEFQDMDARSDTIPKAVKNTFEWCLRDSQVPEVCPELKVSFREWLHRGNGVFHITGKPGAGKSTLMKFIADHNETKTQLNKWAGTRTLVIAKFFSGSQGKGYRRVLRA